MQIKTEVKRVLVVLENCLQAFLKKRTNIVLEISGSLLEDQAGFSKSYDTTDYIFSIDYKKGFNSVSVTALYYTSLQDNIDGDAFRVIHNRYEKAKSCVICMSGNDLSFFFLCLSRCPSGRKLIAFTFSIILKWSYQVYL